MWNVNEIKGINYNVFSDYVYKGENLEDILKQFKSIEIKQEEFKKNSKKLNFKIYSILSILSLIFNILFAFILNIVTHDILISIFIIFISNMIPVYILLEYSKYDVIGITIDQNIIYELLISFLSNEEYYIFSKNYINSKETLIFYKNYFSEKDEKLKKVIELLYDFYYLCENDYKEFKGSNKSNLIMKNVFSLLEEYKQNLSLLEYTDSYLENKQKEKDIEFKLKLIKNKYTN